jgi:fucose 4-O-acetylase-like acetyltransferase
VALSASVRLAYLAGFFDGEGSISTTRGVLRVSVGQVDPTPLQLLHGMFGGTIRRIEKANPNHQTIYHWTVGAKAAGAVLATLLPYLVVKREQAIVGIQLQSRMLHQGGNKGLPAAEKEIRQTLVKRLKDLKRCTRMLHV